MTDWDSVAVSEVFDNEIKQQHYCTSTVRETSKRDRCGLIGLRVDT